MLATAIAIAIGVITFAVSPAQALGAGKMCMFNAPSSTTFGFNHGHVGWLIQEPGTGWWAGSTELGTGDPADTWILSTTSEATAQGFFKNKLVANGKTQHEAGYYTRFRCHSTAQSAVGAAITKARALQGNGYTFWDNNCLTKAVAVFNAYYSAEGLAAGSYTYPNDYFENYLPNSKNWGPIHYL